MKLIEKLATQREVVRLLREKTESVMETALAATNYHQLKELLIQESQQLDEYDAEVRKIAPYTNLPKVQVQSGKEVVIIDTKAAREWCLNNFTPALTLDAKAFKAAIKAGNIPENLGRIDEVLKVKIASDLSEYVDKDELEKNIRSIDTPDKV